MPLSPSDVLEANYQHFVVEKQPLSFVQTRPGYSYCMYRGSNGARCAIGCCLPDGAYDPDMETVGVFTLVESDRFPAAKALLDGCDKPFLATMQNVNDHAADDDLEFTEAYRLELLSIAKRFNLEVPA